MSDGCETCDEQEPHTDPYQTYESPSLVLVINDTKLLMSLCQVN
jgi:hypothetical protein